MIRNWKVAAAPIIIAILLAAWAFDYFSGPVEAPLELKPGKSAGFRVMTWNLEWFPGRYPKARLTQKEAHMAAAKAVLAKTRPDVFLAQEVRTLRDFEKLVSAVPEMRVAAITDWPPFERSQPEAVQNMGIASRLPVIDGWFQRFKRGANYDPPRGFAVAILQMPDGRRLIAYSLHLKSNHGGDDPVSAAENRGKREEAVAQVIEHVRSLALKHRTAAGAPAVLVAGDFNSGLEDRRFREEQSVRALQGEGYHWVFKGVHLKQRTTLPGRGGWPAATFDHILTLELGSPKGRSIPTPQASDHYPVVSDIVLEL